MIFLGILVFKNSVSGTSMALSWVKYSQRLGEHLDIYHKFDLFQRIEIGDSYGVWY